MAAESAAAPPTPAAPMAAPPTPAAPMAAPPITGIRNLLITLSVMLASVMQALDNTIANVALPHIQGSIAATQDQMAWVLTSYIVSAAVMTPLAGWLAGQAGRKRVFLYSVVGFTAASMFCGVAGSLPQIVIARILQGACGAALIPMSQAVLLDINPPERHARAMAIWVLGVAVGPIMGPALGGWLTENYNWRWVFYINVPFGILAFMGIASFMPETALRKSRFDFLGFCSLSLAVLGLQLTLDRGQLKDWFGSPEIWVEASAAAVGFYVFLVHMLTTSRPAFVSPALFKDRNFLAGNLLIFIVGLVMFATLALLPSLLQDLFDYSVLTTGLVTAPRGIGTFIAMFIMGRVGNRVDFRIVLLAGFALTALSLWQMTHFNLQMGEASVIWSGVAQGLGVGFVYVPVAAASFATLAPALRNEGTAFFSLMRNIGSSIGISLVETLLTRNTQILHARLAEHVTMFNPLARQQLHGAAPTPKVLAGLNAMVNQQAQMLAYNNDFKLMLLLTLITIPLVFVLRRRRNAPEAAVLIE
jgi:DHA2 family multidrug resistance protein